MSSFIVTTLNDQGQKEEVWLTPRSVARFMAAPPNLKTVGQLPPWAVSVIVDDSGMALPVTEDAVQIASLLAMASQSMWFGYRYDGDQIWMQRYDSEASGVEVSPSEAAAMGQFNAR